MTAQIPQVSRRDSSLRHPSPSSPSRTALVRRLPALVAALALVSGCAGDAAPAARGTTPPAAAAPTEIPTPPPTVERRNDADGMPIFDPPMETLPGVDLEGAKQAAVRYLDEYTRGLQTGDATYLREHSEQGCSYCAGRVSEVESTAGEGLHLSSDFVLEYHQIDPLPPVDDIETHGVLFELSNMDYVLVDSSGQIVKTLPGEQHYHLLASVRLTDLGWRIEGFDLIDATLANRIRDQYLGSERG